MLEKGYMYNNVLRTCRSIESDDFRADYGPKYPLISEVFFFFLIANAFCSLVLITDVGEATAEVT